MSISCISGSWLHKADIVLIKFSFCSKSMFKDNSFRKSFNILYIFRIIPLLIIFLEKFDLLAVNVQKIPKNYLFPMTKINTILEDKLIFSSTKVNQVNVWLFFHSISHKVQNQCIVWGWKCLKSMLWWILSKKGHEKILVFFPFLKKKLSLNVRYRFFISLTGLVNI